MDAPKYLSPQLAVAPQIEPEDLHLLAAQGFRAVLNNRPEGEAPDQPPQSVIAEAARRAGLEYRFMPVLPGKVTAADAAEFAAVLVQLPAPVVAFCRTGTRSATLWVFDAVRRQPVESVLGVVAAAGFDLKKLRPLLEAAACRGRTPLV